MRPFPPAALPLAGSCATKKSTPICSTPPPSPARRRLLSARRDLTLQNRPSLAAVFEHVRPARVGWTETPPSAPGWYWCGTIAASGRNSTLSNARSRSPALRYTCRAVGDVAAGNSVGWKLKASACSRLRSARNIAATGPSSRNTTANDAATVRAARKIPERV